MPSIVIHSQVFGEMFGTDEMLALFSDKALIQRYLDVEAALARVQAKLGVIPAQAAQAITDVASVDRVDFAALSRRTQIVGYPILPLVEQLSGWAENDLGQYCHWGATTQDIMLMMQSEIGEVLEPFVAGRGASSTMPQKRNPIASEMMLAAAKMVREQHSAMLDAMV